MKKTEILNTEQITQKLNRLSYEILEEHYGEKEIILIGIEGNGYVVARRLTERLNEISTIKTTLVKLSIDKVNPLQKEVKMDIRDQEFKNKSLVIVDDVLNSGKTLIYAVRAFLDKPLKKLKTAVLVDRSHTMFPVKADFVGLSLSTTLQEHIEADLSKKGKEKVYLI